MESSFEQKIDELDTGLFNSILSQTTSNDQKSLLLLQKLIRKRHPFYIYLEIGSYLGGSLQPHLLDPRCEKIVSIDIHFPFLKDPYDSKEFYPGNSVETMFKNLEKLNSQARDKVKTCEATSYYLSKKDIGMAPHLMLIDGDVSDQSVLMDWSLCKSLNPEATVVFHNFHIIYNALDQICRDLETSSTAFLAFNLPDDLFVIDLSSPSLCEQQEMKDFIKSNYRGCLTALASNDHYRKFYAEPHIRWFRKICKKMKDIFPEITARFRLKKR
jgi:hypothetical protein